MKKLTIEQAYRAMFHFLEIEYNYTKSDEIGGLLSSLSWKIFSGSGPADPGAWEDWLKSVDLALQENENASPPSDLS